MTKKSLDLEHKDVTCAVRIPPSLYTSLKQAAHLAQLSLSDVIRSAIVNQIEIIKQEEIEKTLKDQKTRAQLTELLASGDTKSQDKINEIMELMKAS